MKLALNSIITALFLCTIHLNPASAKEQHGELIMLEAAKNIEVHSQKVVKAYFYKQQGIRLERATDDLKKSLELLQKDLVTIQEGIGKDKEEKNIGIFLDYTMNELKDIVASGYSKDNGALLIDYSESLLEGAQFIAQKHIRKKNHEETMLLSAEQLLFLLERINKFYIAYQAGFKDYNNVVQLQQAVQGFESEIAKMNTYTKYSEEVLASRDKINNFWPVAKEFFVDIQKGALPVIVLASVEKLEKELKLLEDFHYNKVLEDKEA